MSVIRARVTSAPLVMMCPDRVTMYPDSVMKTWIFKIVFLVVFVVVSSAADRWSGRTCCDLTMDQQCQHSCRRAKSRDDLSHCRPNEEISFFHCLDRQEVSAQCCGPATSSQCRATCKSLFWASTPSAAELESVQDFCPQTVVSCVNNYTQTLFINPEEAVPCCDFTNSDDCRRICQQAMMSDLKDEQKYDMVITECEEADLDDDMWNCLLLLSAKSKKAQYDHGGRIDLIGMDNAKLQCCNRAITNRCQQLCEKTYSNAWDRYYTELLEHCVNNIKEVALSTCIREVDQPCQMGCAGLQYCTNFNHRPMELFQSCNREADEASKMAVQYWTSGTIVLPNYLEQFIPIKEIHSCRPEVWKAIACTLYIKPCQTRAPVSHICRSDCIGILTECMDTARLPPGITAETFCNRLSPTNPSEPCVSLSTYTEESPYIETASEITTPCSPNPCHDDEICLLRRRKCKHPGDPDCRQYQCRKACRMGEISSFIVPHKTFVRISEVSHEDVHVSCYRGCKCGHNNQILNCKSMGCIEPQQCLLRSGRIQDHDTQFLLECNQCACFSGEMVCTKRTCVSRHASDEELHAYTGLPCNCLNQYIPVCGNNGQTFPNQCIAKCLGFSEHEFRPGSCGLYDPCADSSSKAPCGAGEICVPRKDICLSHKSGFCRQHYCVQVNGECNRHNQDTACDATNEEFSNVCTLMQQGRTFYYWGHCMDTCGRRNLVCGMNGVTYQSECEAWADGVYVDYYDNCHAVGQLLNLMSGEPSCPNIQCPALPTGANCRPITAPGTCCPKCVGEIRILWSKVQAQEAARISQNDQITVRDIIEVFRQHITVLECDAFGYMSIEGDLVMTIAPVTRYPTTLHIQACMSETEKIGSLVSSKSPIIAMYLPTTTFISATTRTSYVVTGNGAASIATTILTSTLVVTSLLLTQLLGDR